MKKINITYHFYSDNLYGNYDENEGVDIEASTDKYAQMVVNAIEQVYPEAAVNVTWEDNVSGGTSSVSVEGADYDEEQEIIDQVNSVADEIWQSQKWYAMKGAITLIMNKMGEQFDWAVIAALMDDDLREQVHTELAPCTNVEFLERYCELHLAKYGEDFTVA